MSNLTDKLRVYFEKTAVDKTANIVRTLRRIVRRTSPNGADNLRARKALEDMNSDGLLDAYDQTASWLARRGKAGKDNKRQIAEVIARLRYRGIDLLSGHRNKPLIFPGTNKRIPDLQNWFNLDKRIIDPRLLGLTKTHMPQLEKAIPLDPRNLGRLADIRRQLRVPVHNRITAAEALNRANKHLKEFQQNAVLEGYHPFIPGTVFNPEMYIYRSTNKLPSIFNGERPLYSSPHPEIAAAYASGRVQSSFNSHNGGLLRFDLPEGYNPKYQPHIGKNLPTRETRSVDDIIKRGDINTSDGKRMEFYEPVHMSPFYETVIPENLLAQMPMRELKPTTQYFDRRGLTPIGRGTDNHGIGAIARLPDGLRNRLDIIPKSEGSIRLPKDIEKRLLPDDYGGYFTESMMYRRSPRLNPAGLFEQSPREIMGEMDGTIKYTPDRTRRL